MLYFATQSKLQKIFYHVSMSVNMSSFLLDIFLAVHFCKQPPALPHVVKQGILDGLPERPQADSNVLMGPEVMTTGTRVSSEALPEDL